jgi:hypothetical protein
MEHTTTLDLPADMTLGALRRLAASVDARVSIAFAEPERSGVELPEPWPSLTSRYAARAAKARRWSRTF